MPNYDTAASILTSISSIQWATQGVQGNRAKINRLMNGDAPWTEDERRANRLNTNINWLEGPRIVKNSHYQLVNAFFGPGDYFTISLDTYSKVPVWKRDEWSACLTSYINKALRDSNLMEATLEQAVAQVVLHGPGPSIWRKRHSVIPETAGIDDVLLPATTLADMSNLGEIHIYNEWTWGKLRDMAIGKLVDPGWNQPYVKALLKSLYKYPLAPVYQGNRWLFPEKIAEDTKENVALFNAAAMAKLLVWDSYHLNEDTGKWNRRMILDYNNISPEGLREELKRQRPEFLFSEDNVEPDWRRIIHFFIGNCSTVAPFRYYSVRSIGYQLYGPAFAQNMARCRTMDHVLQTLLTWFRNVSEDDRERLEDIQLHHLGIFPDGVSMVTAQERYTANWQLVGNFLQSNRQLMAESSAAYLPPMAVEGEKPARTATESLIENNNSVTFTTSVQNQLYKQAKHLWREVVRRICLKDKRDPVTADVLRRMKEDDIPENVLNPDTMEIMPNRVMGGGNRAVELTTARALFDAKGAFGPTADLPIRRKYMLALTNDPEFVRQTLPAEPVVTASSLAAQYAFGTLMEGAPVQQSGSINEVDYIETLLSMMALVMKPLEQQQELPQAAPIAAERIAGLFNVGQHVEQHIQILSQDQAARDRVRAYQRDILGLMNQLKAFGQRITEMEQAQQPAGSSLDAETQAKLQAMQTLAQGKVAVATQTSQVKLQHKDAAFLAEQQRKDAATVAEIRRKDALTHATVAAKDLTTQVDLVHQARQAHLDEAVNVAGAVQEHAQAQVEHQRDLTHAQDEHAQSLQHTQEQHDLDVQAAKAKAAAAPKAKPKAKAK